MSLNAARREGKVEKKEFPDPAAGLARGGSRARASKRRDLTRNASLLPACRRLIPSPSSSSSLYSSSNCTTSPATDSRLPSSSDRQNTASLCHLSTTCCSLSFFLTCRHSRPLIARLSPQPHSSSPHTTPHIMALKRINKVSLLPACAPTRVSQNTSSIETWFANGHVQELTDLGRYARSRRRGQGRR